MITNKFKDIFLYAPKSNIKAGEGTIEGRYPFYTSSSVVSKRIDKALYHTDSLIFGTGGSASVHFSCEPFSTSTDCIVAIATSNNVNIKFVHYYLCGNIHLLERGFKGAGLKHISKKYIDNLDIPILPIETQNKIVVVLDKATSLVNKRKETIQILDKLLLATFLEMFGKQNPQFDSWEEVEVVSFAKTKKGSMRTGPFGSSLKHDEFDVKGDVAVLGIDNAVKNVFKWGKPRFISLEKYEKFKQYTIHPRDVIITIMGTVGRSAVIPEGIGMAINTKHLAAITLDETKCNPYYLAYSIHSNPFVAFQMKSKSRGAIMAGFNLGLIKQLKLKAAPIDLQNKFEEAYLKNRQLLELLLISQKDLENLFNSTLQKVFTVSDKLNFEIETELDALINVIDLHKKENDLSSISGDTTYLQRLIEKLNNQEFSDKDMYDKAKHAIFQLMSEDEKNRRVYQDYNEGTKSIKLLLR